MGEGLYQIYINFRQMSDRSSHNEPEVAAQDDEVN